MVWLNDDGTVDMSGPSIDMNENNVPVSVLRAWLDTEVLKIPVSQRASAVLHACVWGGDDSRCESLDLKWKRPATDAEKAEDAAWHERHKRQQEASERVRYEELKRKYG